MAAPVHVAKLAGGYDSHADEVSDTMRFVRKVYSILAFQLTLTTMMIIAAQSSDSVKLYMLENQLVAITCAVGTIVFMIMIVCCFGRLVPVNYILLVAFTFCESYMVAGMTIAYDPNTVILAGLATALTTVSLTIYALRTTVKIEVFAALSFVVYFAMFPILIIGLLMGLGGMYTLYCMLGVILYSLFLIMDTIMICGGKSLGGVSNVSYDDYIMAAMMLYLDIIMLFVYILKLLGNK